MAASMTVFEFRQLIAEMSRERVSLRTLCSYLKQKNREDKLLREEYLPILAVIDFKRIAANEEIEVGADHGPDARIGESDTYEVVQALPRNEYEIRKGGQRTIDCDGERTKTKFRGIATGGANPITYFEHARDHLQFPDAILKAIELKHRKNYRDHPSLVVVFSGDYSFEDDNVIASWLPWLRSRTTRGTFKEILLVELDRSRVFPLFFSERVPAYR